MTWRVFSLRPPGSSSQRQAHRYVTLRESRTLAQKCGDAGLKLQATTRPGRTSFGRGKLAGVHAHAEAGLAVYNAEMHQPMASSYGDHDARTWARSFSALSLGFAGEAQAARAMARTVRSSSQGASMIRFRSGGHSTSPRQWHRFCVTSPWPLSTRKRAGGQRRSMTSRC
jgi:hypothetical protein